jgi:hypothetical protein
VKDTGEQSAAELIHRSLLLWQTMSGAKRL